METLQVYRGVVASEADGEVYWWYLGTTFVELKGKPPIPVSHPETVMIYDVETVSDEEFKIHWREVGYFRDSITGEIADRWFNPITGVTVKAPRSFAEGPATYTVGVQNEKLKISLTQNHAHVRGIDVTLDTSESLFSIIQTERKVRSFPDSDGTIADPSDGQGAEAQTVLSFAANRKGVEDKEVQWVSSQGTYEFRLQDLPEWMGFGAVQGSLVVHGVIAKGNPGEKINEIAWERLNSLFPDFF